MTFKVKSGVQVGSVLALDANGYLTTRLATARTISLGGDLSGSASFDGSGDITITAAVADDSHSHSNYLTGESDTLATVTARGASTSTKFDANGGIYSPKIGISSSNLADQTNGSPWYGIGASTLTGWYGNQQTVQLAGYYGAAIKTANTQMNFDLSGQTGSIVVSSGYLQSNSSLRSPIFYDSDDTGYYVDPNGVANIHHLRIHGTWGDYAAPWNGQLSIRGGYPSMQFRSSTSNSVWLRHMDGAGEIQHYYAGDGLDSNNWSIKHTMYKDGTFYSSASMRSPIFYDANDTGYYLDPNSTSNLNRIQANNKYHKFGTSDSWDSVGQSALTNVHFQGHDHFWIGAGNGRWFTGTANSGIPSGAGYEHDLLITTMYSDGDAYRGITFATENTGAANNGWRLGKWYSGTSSANSRLIIDGQLFAKGSHSSEADFYANHYDSYRDNAAWAGDSGSGWNTPAIVASQAIQIQSSNNGTSSVKPQIQFHQYGYGGPGIEYDGPNKILRFGDYSGGNRLNWFEFAANAGLGPIRMNHDQIYTPSGNLHLQYSSSGNIDMNYGGGYTFSRTSLRAPIFYDYNNTGYYVDPASQSFMGKIVFPNTSVTAGITSLTNAPIQTEYANAGTTSTWYPLTWQRAQYSSGYVTHVNTGLYKYASGWGGGQSGWYCAVGGNDSYPTQEWRLAYDGYLYNSLGYVLQSGSFRAPIFYDLDNTGYYVDPNGTSNMSRVYAANSGNTFGHVFRKTGNPDTNGSTVLVQNDYGTHSWGITLECRVDAASGDRPSILFTNGGDSNTWSIGYGYADTGYFRINRDHGRINSSWGTTLMTMDRSGNVTFAGNVTAYSDVRIKENIKLIENPIQKVQSLNGVTFNYIEDGREGLGVIAQNVEEVLPMLVTETPNSNGEIYKNVAYGNMVGLLIEAIKEQQDIIDSQETRIARLEALVQQLIGD